MIHTVLGIVGSRSINHSLPDELMPPYIDKIISGGARGIDRCARNYALRHGIIMLEILPEYELYGKSAPLKRNDKIIELCDMVYIFWDKKSHGSDYVIKKCTETGKPFRVFVLENDSFVPMK